MPESGWVGVEPSPDHQIMVNFPAKQSGEQKTPYWWGGERLERIHKGYLQLYED